MALFWQSVCIMNIPFGREMTVDANEPSYVYDLGDPIKLGLWR